MIRTQRSGAVLSITIDNPEAMNGLSRAMLDDLERCLVDFEHEPGLRAGILTGAGEKAFCTGGDLRKLPELRAGREGAPSRLFSGELTDKPLIAAINGHALGGGLDLALTCDVRVASENATFGVMSTARGVMIAGGLAKRLPQTVGMGNAMWLLLSGERIGAHEAHRIGLVNRVVAQDELQDVAREWAALFASRAPLSMRMAKRSARESADLPAAAAFAENARLGAPLFASRDAAEGIRAFAEGRPPVFTGE